MSRDPSISASGVRAKAKAANRRAILDAAREVFTEKGYEAASVRDVIRRTGLASGTFYNYFRSKEELYAALAADVVQRFKPRIAEARRESASFEAFAHMLYRIYFEFFLEETPELSGANEARGRGKFYMPTDVDIVFDEIHDLLEDVFREKRIEGVDPEYVAAVSVGIAREMRVRFLRRKHPDPAEAGRIAATFFLSGLAGLKKEAARQNHP